MDYLDWNMRLYLMMAKFPSESEEGVRNTCFYCGFEFDKTYTGFSAIHKDHYEPKTKGGAHDLENLRPSCPDCNSYKKDSILNDENLPEFRGKWMLRRLKYEHWHKNNLEFFEGIKESDSSNEALRDHFFNDQIREDVIKLMDSRKDFFKSYKQYGNNEKLWLIEFCLGETLDEADCVPEAQRGPWYFSCKTFELQPWFIHNWDHKSAWPKININLKEVEDKFVEKEIFCVAGVPSRGPRSIFIKRDLDPEKTLKNIEGVVKGVLEILRDATKT